MFCLRTNDGLFIHYKGKIIIFNTQEEAQFYLQAFGQYAMNRIVQENPNNPFAAFEVQGALNALSAIPRDELEDCECGFINFSELGF